MKKSKRIEKTISTKPNSPTVKTKFITRIKKYNYE